MAAPPFIQRGALCDFNITDQVRLATAPVRFGFAAKTNSYPSFARGFDGFEVYRRIADWRYRVDDAPLKFTLTTRFVVVDWRCNTPLASSRLQRGWFWLVCRCFSTGSALVVSAGRRFACVVVALLLPALFNTVRLYRFILVASALQRTPQLLRRWFWLSCSRFSGRSPLVLAPGRRGRGHPVDSSRQ